LIPQSILDHWKRIYARKDFHLKIEQIHDAKINRNQQMNVILQFLALVSTIVGTSALYLFLFQSFSSNNDKKQKRTAELEKTIQQKSIYFIISLIVSEFLGIFFLLLTGSLKNMIITVNGFAFLIASCLWSVATIMNALRADKINLLSRFTVQMGTLGFALIFIRISIIIPDPETLAKMTGPVSLLLQFFSIIYFVTSVIAIVFILWDAVTLEVEYLRVYLVWVFLIGLAVGTGLFFISHNWQRLLLNDYSQFFSIFKFLTSYVG